MNGFFRKILKNISRTLVFTTQCGCLTYCALEYIGDFVICSGPSMEPTIFTNDIVLTEHLSSNIGYYKRFFVHLADCSKQFAAHDLHGKLLMYPDSAVHHISGADEYGGDIIISRNPCRPKEYICKRITGLPGNKVKKSFSRSIVVPKGHVWLEGDNKHNSTDSRTYGPVPMALIRGRVIYKIWPTGEACSLTYDISGS